MTKQLTKRHIVSMLTLVASQLEYLEGLSNPPEAKIAHFKTIEAWLIDQLSD